MLAKLIIFFILTSYFTFSQFDDGLIIARLKYSGGGDWYNDPSSEVNLLKFISEKFPNIKTKPVYKFVDISSDEIFSYPILFLTGHGNVVFSNDEAKRLKNYLERGGFLFIDDDYGLDKAIRREMKKVFPEKDFIELPFNHRLFNFPYKFENGAPKIHEHDKKPTQTFAIFVGNRIAVIYTYESNPGDGWADKEVHNNPEEKRLEALKFGANLIIFALSQ
jgi:hypothetical protein